MESAEIFIDYIIEQGHRLVSISHNISSTLMLNTALQGCVLSPLFYPLFTHDRVAQYSVNLIFKFADDTSVVSRFKNNDAKRYWK